MKKKHLAITCLLAAFSAVAFTGCFGMGGGGGQGGNQTSSSVQVSVNDNVYNDEEVTVGGETHQGGIASKTVISGVKDIYISTSKTSIEDEIKNVRAMKGEAVLTLSTDTSKVVFGTKGVYEVTFSAEGVTEKCNVYVYEAPTASAANTTAITLRYSEVYSKLMQGISFTDCFGNVLDAQVISDGGMKNPDGSLEIGTYTVRYMATDKSGQKVYSERLVEVTAETTPSITSASYDMADETMVIPVDTDNYNNFLAVSIDGTTVPSMYVHKANGNIHVNGDYIYNTYGRAGAHTLRYISAKGYKDVEMTLSDQKVVTTDDSALQEFARTYFEAFTAFEIPNIKLTNPRQAETPIYKVYKSGEEVALDGQSVTFNKDGLFELVVTVRGVESRYNLTAFYNLGYSDGFALSQAAEDTMQSYFDSAKYTLLELRVRSNDLQKTYAVYKKDSTTFGDLAVFNERTKALNKKSVYKLVVRAQDGSGELLTQTVDFTVSSADATNILNVQGDLLTSALKPNTPASCSLDYATKTVGGRRGAFHWNTTAGSTGGLLRFADRFLPVLKAGNYLSFDMYIEGSGATIQPVIFIPGTYNAQESLEMPFRGGSGAMYLWNPFLEKEVEGETLVPYYKLYNQAGERITGMVKGQWMTFEIKLPYDVTTATYNGLSWWAGPIDLSVYLANMKVSTTSYRADATVNEEISVTEEMEDYDQMIPDIWDDANGMY